MTTEGECARTRPMVTSSWSSEKANQPNENSVRTANESKTQKARKTKAQAAPARRSPKGKDAGKDARQTDDGLNEAKTAVAAAIDNKAVEPVLLDVRGLCSYASYIVIVSGRSDRHVESMREGISKAMREQGHLPLGTEGVKSGQWALLDYGDCVVHVFYHATREHYDLEGLWIDAQRVPIDVPAESRTSSDDQDDEEAE
jgi:ribosome-associated protein